MVSYPTQTAIPESRRLNGLVNSDSLDLHKFPMYAEVSRLLGLPQSTSICHSNAVNLQKREEKPLVFGVYSKKEIIQLFQKYEGINKAFFHYFTFQKNKKKGDLQRKNS